MNVTFRDRSTEGVVNRKVSERFMQYVLDFVNCVRCQHDIDRDRRIVLCNLVCIMTRFFLCNSIAAVVADESLCEPFKVESCSAKKHYVAAIQQMKCLILHRTSTVHQRSVEY